MYGAVCAAPTQSGVESPGYGVGRYVPSAEAAMYHFHRALWGDLATPP
jgi:choline monooxygenase